MFRFIFNFFLACYPILSAYKGFFSLDLGSILVFIFGLLCLISEPLKLPRFFYGYWPFFIIALACCILSSGTIPLWLVLYTVNFIFATSYGNLNQLLKFYSLLVYASVFYFIFQEITYFVAGVRMSGFIPGIPLIYGDDGGVAYTIHLLQSERSSSFFLEPSYLAQFIYPYIAFLLFSNNSNDIKKAVVLSTLLFWVKSGIGIFLLLILWSAWLLNSRMTAKRKVAIIIGGAFALFFVCVISPEMLDNLLGRANELNYSRVQAGERVSSGFVRFFRGYSIYADMPLKNKIIGAPIDLIESVRDRNPLYYIDKNANFLNGIQMLLIYYGVFACILYIRHILLFAKNTNSHLLWVLVGCTIFLLFSESYLMTSRIFLVTTIMYLLRKNILYK